MPVAGLAATPLLLAVVGLAVVLGVLLFATGIAKVLGIKPTAATPWGGRSQGPGQQAGGWRAALESAVGRLLTWLIGGGQRYQFPLLFALAVVGLGTAAFGVVLFTVGPLSLSAGSSGYVRIVVEAATNFFLWAALTLLAAVFVWWKLPDMEAGKTTENSRFGRRETIRLATEVRSTSGTTRLEGKQGDAEHKLRSKLLSATANEKTDELPQTDATQPETEYVPPGDRDPTADDDGPGGDEGEEETLPVLVGPVPTLRQRLIATRRDIATSINFDEIAWWFVLPAAVTVLTIFTVAQTPWFPPIVYLMIGGAAVGVGSLVYAAQKFRRVRAVKSLRRDRESDAWRAASCLVKRVSTENITIYVAFLRGRVYADVDQYRFCDAVAKRWHQGLEYGETTPSIQEKFAREIRSYAPLPRSFLEGDPLEGLEGIKDDMVAVLLEAEQPEGLLLKTDFCQRVSEAGPGIGHDPTLIGQVYRVVVPELITETQFEIVDSEGRERTVTAVHLRDHTIPDDVASIKAQWSESIQPPDSQTEEFYGLPEVDTHKRTDRTVLEDGQHTIPAAWVATDADADVDGDETASAD